MHKWLLVLGISLALSCKSDGASAPTKGSGQTTPTEPPAIEPPMTEPPPAEPKEPIVTEPTSPSVDPAAMQTTTQGLNDFTIALYKESRKEANTILSPFSVAAALSLLELGAQGETLKSMLAGFGAESSEQHRSGLRGLVHTLKGDGEPIEKYGTQIHPHALRVRNSLWVAKNYVLDANYKRAALELYGAISQTIDVGDPSGSAKAINDWVAEATNNKIKDLIQPSMIGELTRMVLVNAVHFVGRWQEPFMEGNTKDADFYVDGKTVAKVPTMVTGHFFPALDNDEVSIVEMPYWSTSEEAQLAMTIVVPKKRDGLAGLEDKLTSELLTSWLKALTTQVRVTIYLPKWKAESTSMLSEPLGKIGFFALFGPNADLSGISAEGGLHASSVIHKTFINVDERGTEAAAATAIVLAGSAMTEPLDLHVDHPFLYLIRDTKSGVILFIGRITDPR